MGRSRQLRSGASSPHRVAGARALKTYEYDAGQPWNRRKHAWASSTAGFEKRGETVIAKCPAGITREHAERLLNSATRLELETPRVTGPGPDRIYVFAQGVLYRAMRTVAGRSYHAFPEHAKGISDLPAAHQKRLWDWARAQGFEDPVKKWLKQT